MAQNAYASSDGERIRILIADDHHLFTQALQAILAGDARMEVVGVAATGAEAVALALELEPDIVLMDISMPELDGIEATRRLREVRPQACVLMLTGSDATEDVAAARSAGAAAYVTKDRIAAELIEAIAGVVGR